VGVLEVDASLSQPRLRIDCLATVRVNFEVEVGAGGKAHRAHASNLLAGVHMLANGNVKSLHVTINGHGAVVVHDADPLAKAGGWTGVDDRTIHDGKDWGAGRVSDVDSLVEGAPAHGEWGGECAFCRAGYGRCASGLVGSGALFRSLDGLVELISQIGNWLSLGNVEDLRGGINRSRSGILNLGGVRGELEVNGLRLGGGRVIGLDVAAAAPPTPAVETAPAATVITAMRPFAVCEVTILRWRPAPR